MEIISSTTFRKIAPSVAPLVTIAIPTFNRARLLKQCILFALSQSYQNFEILISDNASTDNTAFILNTIDDPRVRVMRQTHNVGLYPNFNACLQEARGDYITFVSDDDQIAPHFLERCVTLLREEALPIVICLNDFGVPDEARTLPAIASDRLETGVFDGVEILKEFLRGKITAQMCSIIMRTAVLRERGGFPIDLPYAGDHHTWIPLLLVGRAGLVNEPCATYVIHSSSATATFKGGAPLHDVRRVTDRIIALADSHIENPEKRTEIQLLARRRFARRIIEILTYYRRGGGPLWESLRLMWHWRAGIRQLRLPDLYVSSRAILRIFTPNPLANALCLVRDHLVPENAHRSALENRKSKTGASESPEKP